MNDKNNSSEIEEFFEKRLRKGKKLVILVIVIEFVMTAVRIALACALVSLSVADLVSLVILSVLMNRIYNGRIWAIYSYAILNVLLMISNLVRAVGSYSPITGILALIIAGIQGWSVWILLANPNAGDFLEEQRKYY